MGMSAPSLHRESTDSLITFQGVSLHNEVIDVESYFSTPFCHQCLRCTYTHTQAHVDVLLLTYCMSLCMCYAQLQDLTFVEKTIAVLKFLFIPKMWKSNTVKQPSVPKNTSALTSQNQENCTDTPLLKFMYPRCYYVHTYIHKG